MTDVWGRTVEGERVEELGISTSKFKQSKWFAAGLSLSEKLTGNVPGTQFGYLFIALAREFGPTCEMVSAMRNMWR
jgi:hypothetical protein